MTMLLTFIEKHWISITIIILVSITTLSLWPVEHLPPAPGSDKTHHFIAYAALMFPTALRRPKYWKLIGLSFILYSGLIELVQPYVNRYGEWLDMAANATGVGVGVIIAKVRSYF